MGSEQRRAIRTFGRRGGRALSARQQRLIDDVLPQLSVSLPNIGQLDPEPLFPRQMEEIWLEIGFGGGEHLTGQANRHPEVGLIGCEPFIEGMAKALTQIEEDNLSNVRLHMDDARDVIAALKPASIDRVFILFPDPWPKTRQHKRRLIQQNFLTDISRVLKPDASLRFATDVKSYVDEALGHFLAHPSFAWSAEVVDDWRQPPEDHITTRYEAKRLGDCDPVWFDFKFVH